MASNPTLQSSYNASVLEQYAVPYMPTIDIPGTIVRVQSQQVVNPNPLAFQLLDTFSIIVNDPADISDQQSERVNAINAQVVSYLTTLYTSAYYRNLLLTDQPSRGLTLDATSNADISGAIRRLGGYNPSMATSMAPSMPMSMPTSMPMRPAPRTSGMGVGTPMPAPTMMPTANPTQYASARLLSSGGM